MQFLLKGYKLYRIQALRDINRHVKKGDKGGYVEKLGNLSEEGLSWLYNDSKVLGDAYVYDNAIVADTSIIRDGSYVGGYTMIKGASDIQNDIQQPLVTAIITDGKLESEGEFTTITELGIFYWDLTAYKSNQGISITHGNYHETLDDFTEKVKNDEIDCMTRKAPYLAAIEYIKAYFELT